MTMHDESEAKTAPLGHEPVDSEECRLVSRVVAGDEEAVAALVDRYYASMACVAAAILGDAVHASDVVQEAWIRVLHGIGRFEFRSSLKTWILRITANVARTLGPRLKQGEQALWSAADEASEATVEATRFNGFGGWRVPPVAWADNEPEAALLRKEIRALVQREIEALPPNQRAVVTLRDIEGMGSDEVCDMLGISDANLRVLLHRGRARLRAAVARELGRA